MEVRVEKRKTSQKASSVIPVALEPNTGLMNAKSVEQLSECVYVITATEEKVTLNLPNLLKCPQKYLNSVLKNN